MRWRRHQIGEKNSYASRSRQLDNRVKFSVSTGDDAFNARQHFACAIQQLELTSALQRLPVIRQIAGFAARIGILCSFEFAILCKICRIAESRHYFAILVGTRIPADMIEMHVRHDNVGDIRRFEALCVQIVEQVAGLLDGIDFCEFGVVLVADAGIDKILWAPRMMSRQFKPIWIWLLSSAGSSRCHNAFGTTPNMAPPSSLKLPSEIM